MNNTLLDSFPHSNVEYIDNSVRPIPVINVEPLHLPIFAGFAKKGEGMGFGDYNKLSSKFGKETFEVGSDYYYHPNFFARSGLNYQQLWFYRLIPDDAKTATLGIFCKVTKNVQVTQYEKDASGKRIVDQAGNWVPKEKGGHPVKEVGVKLEWMVRELTAEEKYYGLDIKTLADGSMVYPIQGFTAPSAYGSANLEGISIWFDHDDWSKSITDSIGSMLFRASIIYRPEGVDKSSGLPDVFDTKEFEFTFKPKSTDPSTGQKMFFKDLIGKNYKDIDLPFHYHMYSDNALTIGNLIKEVEKDDTYLKTGWLVNIFDGVNSTGGLYDHVEYTDASVQLDKNIIHYMEGGSDGTLTPEVLNAKTKEFYNGVSVPEITDRNRFPITAVYDTGFPLETKKSMIGIYGLIKNGLSSWWATQDVHKPLNTPQQDLAAGAALVPELLLHPASTIHGTQAFSGIVQAQAGELNSDLYDGIVSVVYNQFIKNCIKMGGIRYKGPTEGYPANGVTEFKELNWYPSNDKAKRLAWNTGLNYAQYVDMENIHIPDTQTVYPTKNSLFSSKTVVEKIIIYTHICRKVANIFYGRSDNITTLFGDIEAAISKRVNDVFGNHFMVTPTVTQKAIDKALGYAITINSDVRGNFPLRVLNFDIYLDRKEG